MSAPAIELRDVRKSFGSTKIIQGVSLAIAQGERHAIIGPNGAGKSTLYNLISGRFPVTSGTIHLNGEEITGLSPFEINRKGLSRSFQVTNIFHNMTVYENIRCGVLWSLGYRYSFWHLIERLRDARERWSPNTLTSSRSIAPELSHPAWPAYSSYSSCSSPAPSRRWPALV